MHNLNPKLKANRRERERERANQRGGRVNREEWDLVDLGSEDSEQRAGRGEAESAIAGRELLCCVEVERGFPSESEPQGEPVGASHRRVTARRVLAVVVARSVDGDQNHQDQSDGRKRRRLRSANRHGRSRIECFLTFLEIGVWNFGGDYTLQVGVRLWSNVKNKF